MLSVACFGQDDKKGTIKVKKVETQKIDTIQGDPISVGYVVEAPLTVVEQMPQFPGGQLEMKKFISQNLKYPQKEKESAPSGKVYITFLVEIDGSLTNIKVLRGIPKCSACDLEALRVMKLMPKWIAGKQNNVAVPVQCNVSMYFEMR